MLFNKVLKITPHNTQKRTRRKERTSLRSRRLKGKGKRETRNAKREGRARREGRYSRWVTHPVSIAARQGLT